MKRKLRIELAEMCNVFSLKSTGVHRKINKAAAKSLVQKSLPGGSRHGPSSRGGKSPFCPLDHYPEAPAEDEAG